ncbi:hypothetical protein ABZ208_07340 [Streptomyces sp. NPDC006208]|uniref:hypothetical protein n=1 Tax=Streptomyces sp. NPDC006208 TaxID=3156734 RepID=UPI0033A68A78
MNRRTIALLGALLLATGCSATGGPESKGQGGKEPPLDTALTVRTGSDGAIDHRGYQAAHWAELVRDR